MWASFVHLDIYEMQVSPPRHPFYSPGLQLPDHSWVAMHILLTQGNLDMTRTLHEHPKMEVFKTIWKH